MKTKYIIKTKLLLLLFAVFAISGNAQTFDWETATLFNTGCTDCAAEQTIGSNFVSFRATNSSVIHLSNAGQGTTGLSIRNSQPQPETFLTFFPSVNVQSLRLFATANNQNWTISQLDNTGNVLNTITTNVNIASAVATLNWTNVHQIEIKVTAGLNQSFGVDDVVFTPYTLPCTVNIPDANFKAALVGNTAINTNGDTEIQCSEATAFTGTIDVNSQNISDLTGIEAFTALTELSCYQNQLTSLDVSQNTALSRLYCHQNQLTSLDVTQNTALIHLYCYSNQLTSLDVSQNTALTLLYCYSNQLTSLDVTQNTALSRLYCYSNQLTSLDVTQNTALTHLYCYSNQLTSLNLANGNNSIMTIMRAENNPNLTCIQHDAGFTPPNSNNWQKDTTASFSTNCATPCTVNIPDANFKAALVGNTAINTNGDAEIQCSEATAFTGTIDVNSQNISDLTGIERL